MARGPDRLLAGFLWSAALELLRDLEDLFLPPRCLACGREGDSAVSGLCPDCREQVEVTRTGTWEWPERWLPAVPPGLLAGAVSGGVYAPPLSALVHMLKFGGVTGAALPLASLLAESTARHHIAARLDALVAVPSHALKRWSRGVDHTARIAENLGRRLGLPVIRGLLSRRRATIAQAQVRGVGRRAQQLAGVFRVGRIGEPLRLGLVDDLVTTGATAAECAAALLRAGSGPVLLLAAAAAPPPPSTRTLTQDTRRFSPEAKRRKLTRHGRPGSPPPVAQDTSADYS